MSPLWMGKYNVRLSLEIGGEGRAVDQAVSSNDTGALTLSEDVEQCSLSST